jgi:hypothetical protein
MNEKEFIVRAYGKSELAMLYFPGDSKATALKKLRYWLKVNKRLRKFITPKRKYYSPKQVRVIIDELGEPDIQ